jgi:flagellar hook-length control protein FliK
VTATTPSDQPAAPLAIAAAAIAASVAIAGTGAPGSSGAPAGADTATAAATTANAGKVAKAAGVKTEAPVITTADATTAEGAATATGDATLAATIAAGTPTKTTTQAKVQVAAKDATATAPADQDSAATGSGGAAPAAPTTIVPAAAPAAAVAGKAKAAADGAADAIKADASGDGSAAPTPPVGGHTAQLTTPDPSAQAANAIQPQLTTTQTTPSATAQLMVTNAAQSAAVPLSGLAMQIAASAKSGKSRFEIRLDPAELGRIDVRIDVDRNGQVTSHLTVERPETLSMLRQDANQLQRALDNAGLSTGNGGLQFSLRDQSQSGQNNNGQPNPNAHRLIVAEEDSVPAAVAGRSYGRTTGALGGVDIRV